MPIISLDYSKGHISALFVKEDWSSECVKIPISIPYIFYANRPSEFEIFNYALKRVSEIFKIKLEDTIPLYVSSLIDLDFEMKNLHKCAKHDAFKALHPTEFLYFSHSHVGSSNGIFRETVDYSNLLKNIFFNEEEETIKDYFENIKLYPNVVPASDRDSHEEEAYLSLIAGKHCQIGKDSNFDFQKQVILSTTRDIGGEELLSRFVLLCTQALCGDGFYYFKLDNNNYIGSVAALAYFDKDTYLKVTPPSFLDLGSIICLEDDIKCKVELKSGENQEFKVNVNQVFNYPIKSKDSVQITIQSKKYGKIEREVFGGVFGLVIDTRQKNRISFLTPDEKRNTIKKWENTLIQGLKGL